jgi:hypothetical protein
MGLLDFIFKRKERLDDPRLPTGPAHSFSADMAAMQARPDVASMAPSPRGSPEVQMDLLRTQLENMRMQYEAINARLQNIERIVMEIRSFWK